MTIGQIDVFVNIAKYIKKNGISPTYGDVARMMNKKRGTVFGIIKGLEKNGYIKLEKGIERGIKIVGDYEYDEHIYFSEDDIET